MLKRKCLKIKYLLLALSFFLLISRPAQAETGFELSYEEEAFQLSTSELLAWKGAFQIPEHTAGTQKPLTTELLAGRHFGKLTSQPETFTSYSHNPENIFAFVEKTAVGIDREAQEPVLSVQDGQITEFMPPVSGLRVNARETALEILNSLRSGKETAQAKVEVASPKKTLGETNSLGIRELLARGESNFKGSPNNRRHNIKIGTEKFQGILIKPGETFSFNEHLGPVEAEQGFLPELVIKRTGTVPELGGGLCQVSSTAFRAAMQAGLPIVQRKNHAYAVKYYAPQGTDATIYPGIVDLKFENDTDGYILVWAYFKDKDNIIFDFYGTKDERQVTLQKPIQYDHKPDGSMKASWTRQIFNNGTTTTETFKSVYQSPDLFKVVESFVPAATSTPTTQPVSTAN